jgi:hypothetical protein
MKKYKADLGCWEAGVAVEFEAKDKRVAVLKAAELLQEEMDNESIPQGSIIVQVSEENTLVDWGYIRVYDYMNGMLS